MMIVSTGIQEVLLIKLMLNLNKFMEFFIFVL